MNESKMAVAPMLHWNPHTEREKLYEWLSNSVQRKDCRFLSTGKYSGMQMSLLSRGLLLKQWCAWLGLTNSKVWKSKLCGTMQLLTVKSLKYILKNKSRKEKFEGSYTEDIIDMHKRLYTNDDIVWPKMSTGFKKKNINVVFLLMEVRICRTLL